MASEAGTQLLLLESVKVTTDGKPILRGVDWQVDEGQHWVVIGPNGGGKSTLVRVATLGQHPTEGTVTAFGHRLGTVDIRPIKKRIGLASGSLADQLRGQLTAEEVVRCGRFAALEPWWHTYTPEDHDKAVELLGVVGLQGKAERAFVTLSSGERQRALVARSLMNDPSLIVLDEPTAGLDLSGREELVATLESLARPAGASGGGWGARLGPAGTGVEMATAFVTHHVEDIPSTTTHLLAVADGVTVASGPIAATLTGELLSELFRVEVELTETEGRWAARARR